MALICNACHQKPATFVCACGCYQIFCSNACRGMGIHLAELEPIELESVFYLRKCAALELDDHLGAYCAGGPQNAKSRPVDAAEQERLFGREFAELFRGLPVFLMSAADYYRHRVINGAKLPVIRAWAARVTLYNYVVVADVAEFVGLRRDLWAGDARALRECIAAGDGLADTRKRKAGEYGLILRGPEDKAANDAALEAAGLCGGKCAKHRRGESPARREVIDLDVEEEAEPTGPLPQPWQGLVDAVVVVPELAKPWRAAVAGWKESAEDEIKVPLHLGDSSADRRTRRCRACGPSTPASPSASSWIASSGASARPLPGSPRPLTSPTWTRKSGTR